MAEKFRRTTTTAIVERTVNARMDGESIYSPSVIARGSFFALSEYTFSEYYFEKVHIRIFWNIYIQLFISRKVCLSLRQTRHIPL